MNIFIIPVILLVIIQLSEGVPLRLQKRAAFYIANETACVVDNTVYSSGDPIPTDDPCEACKCRPPGFACVLKECETKPGCRAVRRAGHCCPEYICDSDNSSTVEYAFSTEKVDNFHETTINPQTPETTQYSELPEKSTQEIKIEENVPVIPAILDPSILFSSNEDPNSNLNVQTTKKDTTTESVGVTGTNDDINFETKSSEDISSEKQTESATDLLKTVLDIVNEEEKHKEPERSSESSHTEVSVDQSTPVISNANAELFATVTPTVNDEVKIDHTVDLTTVSNTSEFPDKVDDLDTKANEVFKKFRSLENRTSEDEIQSSTTDDKGVTPNDKSKDSEVSDSAEVTKTSDHSETPVITTPSEIKDSSEENTFKKDLESNTNDHSSTGTTTKPEKLYYNSEEKEISLSVETVTTVVQVKEQASSDKVAEETSTPVSNDAEQLLFKALSDVGKLGDKQETTKKSDEATTSQETVKASDSSTIKVIDEISTLPSSISSQTVEKAELYGAEDNKIVSSTETHKVTEVENSTTETVPKVTSEKVEEPVKK